MTTEIKTMIGLVLLCAVILVGGAYFYQKSSGPQAPDILTSNQDALVRENSVQMKAVEEKLVVVEFADFQCPACAFVAPYVKQLAEEYKDKVTFVFRDFPLTNIHRNAIKSAQMARIANEQGKYMEMSEKLYASQDEWGSVSNPADLFMGYATEIGMNTEGIREKLDSDIYVDAIRADTRDGELLGVNSTPTFFVGNTIIRTANYQQVKAEIDAQLAVTQ